MLCGHDDAMPRHQAAARRQRQVGGLPDGQGELAGTVGGAEAQAALLLQAVGKAGWEGKQSASEATQLG